MHHQQLSKLSKQTKVLIFLEMLDACKLEDDFWIRFHSKQFGDKKTFNVYIALCYCILTNQLPYKNNLFQKWTNGPEKCLLIG